MDPVRNARRKLFRRQAIDAFVGVFGDGMTPDLLAPRPRRLQRVATACFIVLLVAWMIAARLV